MTTMKKNEKTPRAVKIARIKRIVSIILIIAFLLSSFAWLGYIFLNKQTKEGKNDKRSEEVYKELSEKNKDNSEDNNVNEIGNENEAGREDETNLGRGTAVENETSLENGEDEESRGGQNEEINEIEQLDIDFEEISPNELGKIMIVMFHNFVETFTSTKYDTGEYTITFKAFEELLYKLYDKGYRLINLKDYIENNISVPAGCTPIVFTFDDGTPGQFNLIEENGELKASEYSAVGVMEKFYSKHPDFGLGGTFYVNLGSPTFNGKGTLAERLQYLIDKGFEIGNHTLNHIPLNNIKSSDKLMAEIGGNQKRMYELVPGYKMFSFSLPNGAISKELAKYLEQGEYEGVEYKNLAVVEVGWDPALSPVSDKIDLLSLHRVRSPGMVPEKFDLNWWLDNISKADEYISDGNPNIVTIPKDKADSINDSKLADKQLFLY